MGVFRFIGALGACVLSVLACSSPGAVTKNVGDATGTDEGASAETSVGPPAQDAQDAVVDEASAMSEDENLGAACMAFSDCGGHPCVPMSDDFPGGYCSALCTANSDCGPTGVCEATLFLGGNGLPEPICLLGCTSSSACRADYFCDTSRGPGVCMPKDCRRTAAACAPGQAQCNQATGGCTSSSTSPGYPATFPTPPQLQQQPGGKILATPSIVPMFFSNDQEPSSPVPDMVSFFQGVGQTNFWRTLQEYGVGAPTGVTPVMLGEAAPVTIEDDDGTPESALKTLLAGFIASGTGGTPAPDGNTLYVLIFPSGTTITRLTQKSCATFGGYHDEMVLADGTSVPYVVLPRCPGSLNGFPSDIDLLTGAASHELAEGTTDPFPRSEPAWLQVDAPHMYFDEANSGAEVADMCENDPEAFWDFGDFAFYVQRIWSNAAAAAGHDPCVPSTGNPFFASVPVLDDTTSLTLPYGAMFTTSAVDIAVGHSKTVPLDLYSDGPTAPWTVTVADYACLMGTGPLLDITLAPGTGNATCGPASGSMTTCITQSCTGSNGDTINMTINVVAAGSVTENQSSGTELFLITSTQAAGSSSMAHIGWGLVGS